MDRPRLLEMAHRTSAPEMDLGRFAVIFGEWDFTPIYAKLQIIGVLMSLENEIHMALEPQHWRRTTNWRSELHNLAQPLINKYGCVTTTVQNTDQSAQRFIKRLGFVEDHAGEFVTTFLMKELKLKKRNTSCPQSP